MAQKDWEDLVAVVAAAVALQAHTVLLVHRETEQLLGEGEQAEVVKLLAGQQAEEVPRQAQQEDRGSRVLQALVT